VLWISPSAIVAAAAALKRFSSLSEGEKGKKMKVLRFVVQILKI